MRILTLLLALICTSAQAEQLIEQDGYRVHYAAMASRDFSTKVARQYGLNQSARSAVLILTSQKLVNGKPMPAAASATGTARSFSGHVQTLELRAVNENGANDLLTEFEVLNGEVITFDLSILPDGAKQPLVLKFQQTFYPD